ncbi:hypothetical protein [Nonomuraea maritima]|uniref:hypothetical protein n=1 Tax=Nonomuraea maritima TaxID=683260 RepID=UPI003722EC7C
MNPTTRAPDVLLASNLTSETTPVSECTAPHGDHVADAQSRGCPLCTPGTFLNRFASILAEQAHAMPGEQLLALYDEGNQLGGVSQLVMRVVRTELARRSEIPPTALANGGQR